MSEQHLKIIVTPKEANMIADALVVLCPEGSSVLETEEKFNMRDRLENSFRMLAQNARTSA